MSTLELTKEQAQDIAWGECDPDVFKREEVVMEDTSRWEIQYSCVFQYVPTGLYYQVFYWKGATECQESQPFEYDDEPILADQVQKVTKTVEVWEVVSD